VPLAPPPAPSAAALGVAYERENAAGKGNAPMSYMPFAAAAKAGMMLEVCLRHRTP